tara:strand:- start:18 stop:512 length:495 start_codon:yes stop_codon:yes gene_type:complete
MSNLKLLFIILLISTIIIIFRSILNKEDFQNQDLLKDLEVMNQNNSSTQKKIILDSVDKSLDLGRGKQGAMAVSKSFMDEELLNLYVNNLINSDKGNPNKILDVGDSVLPRAPNDNYAQYNHEMRMLIDTRKIKQDYVIKVLRSKLEVLRNSLNNVNKIAAELK